MRPQVYLDWNATAPLSGEARAAMVAAMDVVGNPSSVHAYGRAAKGIVEKGREQVAALVGCEPSEVVFTSGATEAAAIARGSVSARMIAAPVEHDALWSNFLSSDKNVELPVDRDGLVDPSALDEVLAGLPEGQLVCIQAANSETGVLQKTREIGRIAQSRKANVLVDFTQVLGKFDPSNNSGFDWREERPAFGICSAHKLGGPKGVGALIVRSGVDVATLGGGQEQGRRHGTENVIGIAGFGAAAEAAGADLAGAIWNDVSDLRHALETTLVDQTHDMVVIGKDAPRLANTSCFAVPGWKGETQVMQMDLAGFAVSAGSACSSGKVKESRVLRAMGYDADIAGCAIRVSLGPVTATDDIMSFAQAWLEHYRRFKSRALNAAE